MNTRDGHQNEDLGEDRKEQEHARQNAAALVGFLASLIEGSATLLAPSLRQLPAWSPATTPEVSAEELFYEPLRVLGPRVVHRMRRFASRLSIVLILTLAVVLMPPIPGLEAEGQRGLAAFVFTGSILALEPVSLPIAALMVPVAQVFLGVSDVDQALSAFSKPTVFLILASLFLAEALRKHGLTRRLAMTTVVASGGGTQRLLLGIMAVAAFFSMWVENTATAAILIPVALTISRQIPDPEKARPFLILLVLGIAYSASLGGMATITGSGSNAVAAEFLTQVQSFRFVDWMIYGVPALLLIFPVTWWLLLRILPVEVKRLDVAPAREDLRKQGPISRTERQLIGTLGVTIFFWIFGAGIEGLVGLPPTSLSATVVAILAVGYLSVRQIIDWNDVKGVSWGIFFIIGAGLSLGEALSRTGVTDWLATLITPVVSGPPLLVTLMVLVYLSALLTNILNNTTIAAVFVPILIAIAQADPSLNAVQLVLAVTLATTFGYSLPSASGRMALVSGTGIVQSRDMMRYGLIMTGVSAAILGLYFWVLSLLNLT
jgi:sodium-dependent dicarboxylate transporter 2/3/5